MATPTQEQIALVQANLVSIQSLNDNVHDMFQDRIGNAFLLLSEPDESDPGNEVVLDLLLFVLSLLGTFAGGVGPVVGAVATAAGTLMGGLAKDWKETPPENLNGQFASYLIRFSNSIQALNDELAKYHDNVAEYWDTSFSCFDQTTTLSDLAVGTFPSRTGDDTDFEALVQSTVFALDQQLWSTLLSKNYRMTYWGQGATAQADPNGNPPADISALQKSEPYTFIYWAAGETGPTYVPCFYTINSGSDEQNTSGLNTDSCNYLFQDLIPGVVNNPLGLFTKQYVFTPNPDTIGGSDQQTKMGLPYDSYSSEWDPLHG